MTDHFAVKQVITTNEDAWERVDSFTRDEWAKLATAALAERDRLIGEGRCVISPDLSAATACSDEHVIPQGTGIRWIKLPRGATADRNNARASDWERMFLRDGLMGMLRPFFVGGKKESTFTDGGRRIVFRNDPDRGFIIETHDVETLSTPSTGPGTLHFVLPVAQAPTLAVSRALHKIAYLTLVTVNPAFAFSNAFDDIRRYLSVDEPAYRPYAERFLPGAGPGANVTFHLRGVRIEGVGFGGDHAVATIRIHHALYVVPLVGEVPPVQMPGLAWYLHPTGVGRKKVTLSFSYDALGERTA